MANITHASGAAIIYPRMLPAGDSAILIELENRIAPAVHAQAIVFQQELRATDIPGVLEIVTAYRSLLVHYDCLQISYATLSETISPLLQLLRRPSEVEWQRQTQGSRRWRVPVHYGGEAGIDLDELARLHDLSTAEVIRYHLEGDYRIYMMGFAPGWCYLGGLHPQLHTPRLAQPRSKVPAGCISIGGPQTMLGGQAMPSGWRLLGQTPVHSYAPGRAPLFLFAPGDHIDFYRITAREFATLARAAANGDAVAEVS